jgi:hypothetical protein
MDVVIGRSYKVTQDALTSEPPTGYDSICTGTQTPAEGQSEVVTYSRDAIRPSFLVMYEP